MGLVAMATKHCGTGTLQTVARWRTASLGDAKY